MDIICGKLDNASFTANQTLSSELLFTPKPMLSPSLSSRRPNPKTIITTTSSQPFSSSRSSSRTVSLKVLSYNVNGLMCLNGDRLRKLRSIAAFIAAGHFDLVALQEVFCAVDAHLLAARLHACLPFSHWFTNASAVGSPGLMILSRWPLAAIAQRQFSLQGNPLKFYHGDALAGKGVGYVRVMVPMEGVSNRSNRSKSSSSSKNKAENHHQSKGGSNLYQRQSNSTDSSSHLTVHFFNTHLLANYGGETTRESQYSIHRLAQAYELATFVEAMVVGCSGGSSAIGRTLPANSVLLLAGDLNTLLTDPGYDLLLTRLALFDAHLCPNVACSCYKSANRRFPAGLAAGGCPRADKIDYILLRLGGNLSSLLELYRETGQAVVDDKQVDDGRTLVASPMSDHLPVVVRVVLSVGGSSDCGGHLTVPARTAMGECSQSACLQLTARLLAGYLEEQSHRGLLLAGVVNLLALFAFSISLFAAGLQPLEALLLLPLYLATLYAVILLKTALISAECKGLQTVLTLVRFDLARLTRRHDILLIGGDPL